VCVCVWKYRLRGAPHHLLSGNRSACADIYAGEQTITVRLPVRVCVCLSVWPYVCVGQWFVTSQRCFGRRQEASAVHDYQRTTNASRTCLGCDGSCTVRSQQVRRRLMHLLSRYIRAILQSALEEATRLDPTSVLISRVDLSCSGVLQQK